METGDLTRRATLLEPSFTDNDPDGQPIDGYVARSTVWCNVLPRRGGESIQQARMEARNPAIITVRASRLTRRITNEWRVMIGGKTFDVKEDPQETQDRMFLQFYAETRGV